MSPFLAALHGDRILLMDGAMGSELRRRGLADGEYASAWCVTQPGKVLALHRAYRDAGASCLLTCTFQHNPITLARQELDNDLDEISEAALALARSAAGRSGFVLADIGPILPPEARLEPATYQDFPDRKLLRRAAISLLGADAFLLETCSSPQALAAVEYLYRAAGELEDAPLLVSFSFLKAASGKLTTFTGHSPERLARHADVHGVSALGVNCGRDIGMSEILEIVNRYQDVTHLPIFIRPNAGTPTQASTGEWVYPLSPAEMADGLPPLLAAGVRMVGGCCGAGPEHVAALRAVLDRFGR